MIQLGLVGPALQVLKTIGGEVSIMSISACLSHRAAVRSTDKAKRVYGNISRNLSLLNLFATRLAVSTTKTPILGESSATTAQTRETLQHYRGPIE